ncbi:MAG: two-component regulator propeller domain-containing protein [Pseudomonadota bacterium]
MNRIKERSIQGRRRACLAALAGVVAFVCCGAAAASTPPQPMRFERLTAEQGLAQNSVMAIVQDQRGFLWFATENGLNRYDGQRFLHFQFDRADPNSLPADYVTDLALTADGQLWVGTDGGGIALWNSSTAGFERVTSAHGLSDDKIQRLAYDPRGYLWVGTLRDGLNRLDLRSGKITVFKNGDDPATSLSDDSVRALLVDIDGTVWIGTNGGLDRYDPATNRIERVAVGGDGPTNIAGDRVRTLARDSSGTLWVGTQRGGLSRSTDGVHFQHYRHEDSAGAISNNRVEALLEDNAGRLWVATADGLNRYLPDSDLFVTYRYASDVPTTLSDNNTIALYQDRGGLLWVGTKTAGVNKWNPRTWSFGHVLPELSDDASHRIRHVTSFADADDDGIWFGSFGAGLTRLDANGDITQRIDASLPDGRGLDDDRVMALAGDSSNLWIGTMMGGLSRMNTTTGDVTTYRTDPADPNSLAADGIMSLLIDSRGRLWIGTFGGGVDMLEPGASTFTHFPHDAQDPASLASPRATAIAEDTDGNLWVGTDGGGLHRLGVDASEWERFSDTESVASGFLTSTVYALHVDDAGRLWVGTREGLYRADDPSAAADELAFRLYDDRNGLADDSVYGIRADNSGRIWVSTNRGLSSVDIGLGTVQNYSVSHGLQAFEFNFGAHFESANGRLLFGGPNGFNIFDPMNLAMNSTPPLIALTGLELLNRPLNDNAVYDAFATLELDYTDDVVTFEFAALDFAAPTENQFAYKLEGFDRDWVNAGNQHRTTYTNLNGGQYTFRVRASNSDGIWTETGLAMDIRVEPPPWLTPWAYLLYAATAIGIGFAIWQSQERKLRQRAEYSRQLEVKVDERTREIAARNRELEHANQKLHQASYTDPLTGLRNRRFFFEEIGSQLNRVAQRPVHERRDSPDEFVFLMIDLDHFKPVNDTHGHQAGDRLLVGVAQALENLCRSTDTVIRWGGDEFLMVARRAGSDEASHLAERIRAAVASSVFPVGPGQVARTTSSIGYASYPFFDNDPTRLSWEQTLKVADIVMYRAKTQRNSWCGVVGVDYPHGVDTLLEAMHQDLDDLHEQGQIIITEAIRDSSEKIA